MEGILFALILVGFVMLLASASVSRGSRRSSRLGESNNSYIYYSGSFGTDSNSSSSGDCGGSFGTDSNSSSSGDCGGSSGGFSSSSGGDCSSSGGGGI